MDDALLDKLWLPSSYLRHLPRLYDAAREVEAWSACDELLEGTSLLDQTRLEHPVFRFVCRDEAGRTFSLVVDGPTLQKVDETRPEGLVSFDQLEKEQAEIDAEERERQARLAQRDALQAQVWASEKERREWIEWWEVENERRERLWEQCVVALRERVGNMQALEWLNSARPEPAVLETPSLDYHPPLSYTVDFNAENYQGEPLFYRAVCMKSEDGVTLDIGARDQTAGANKRKAQ
ncbi:hypothetical protein [Marinimicrobium sp. ARAG 43.8]|uniref:hypothetical protein n=1 Tax=Marinimicrobium sp. ARAG 43.8 TaxID=3418719 RepID=UPI003CF308F8